MISTVTTSTVSTITTVAAIGLGAVAGAMGSATLMGFLAAKELVPLEASARLKRISRVVMVGIVPLTMAFVATVILKVAGVLV
ncbi:MAG: hypothetical protein AB1603_03180 [Chloroflexota bacterium]